MDAFFPSWVILPECATNEFKDLLQTYSQSTHFWVGWWTPGEPGEQHSNLFRTTQRADGGHEIQNDRVFCHITLKERGIAGNDVRWPRVKVLLHSLSPEDRLEASQFWQGFQQCLEKLEIGVRMVELPAIADDSAAETPVDSDEPAEPQVDSDAVAEQLTPAEDEAGKMGIFFAYAREDEDLRDELEKHLSMLKREGVITSWHDRKIGVGKEWEGEIDTHLNTARVILLLISSDFIDSDYCWDVEVKRAMERHEVGEARVIPVILRPVDWESAPFGKLQALPTDAKPVTTWANQDEAFLDVARGIRAAVTELRAKDKDSDSKS